MKTAWGIGIAVAFAGLAATFPAPAQGQLDPAQGQLDPAQGQLDPAQGQLDPAQGQLDPAQGQLDRLDSDIRAANGSPSLAVATGQRAYLGAVADDNAGRGVRVLSVRSGGPADHAGLRPQDLIVSAAGRGSAA